MTDEFKSLPLLGWYGSAYLLAFGTSFPLFTSLQLPCAQRWHGRPFALMLLASIASFCAGNICCYLASNGVMIAFGRALCGCGAAATLSGIVFLLETIFPKTRYKYASILLGLHGTSRFVGPL